MNKRKKVSTSLYLVAVDLYDFEVHRGNLIRVVNLQTRACSCSEFMLDEYMCIYASIVFMDRDINVYGMCDSLLLQWCLIYSVLRNHSFAGKSKTMACICYRLDMIERLKGLGSIVYCLKERPVFRKNIDDICVPVIIEKHVHSLLYLRAPLIGNRGCNVKTETRNVKFLTNYLFT